MEFHGDEDEIERDYQEEKRRHEEDTADDRIDE
jgi:hypothetical protein